MKNKILITFAVIFLGAGLLAVTKVSAKNSSNGRNSMQSIVQKIADRFGLKKEDVQAVFDQERQDRQAEKEARYMSYLDQLVKDGKITEEQKQLIIQKHKEIEANRITERKTLEDWASKNGIDIRYLMGGFGGHLRWWGKGRFIDKSK